MSEPPADALLARALAAAESYPAYRQHLRDLLAEGRTTGTNQSPAYVAFAELNEARMDRLDRRSRLTDEFRELLSGLQRDYLLLVLSEGWCGDAAQTVPVMNWMAEASPRVELRVALRDEHLELMDGYLTDGGQSIPKLLFLAADTREVLADWGPRPLVAQAMMRRYKRLPEAQRDYEAFQRELHGWYARDKTRSTQGELAAMFGWVERGLEDR